MNTLRTIARGTFLLLLLLAALVVILRFIFPLPDIDGRSPEYAQVQSSSTILGGAKKHYSNKYPGKSGVIALADGVAALHSRLELIKLAEASIDIQYYIWHADVSGMLMLDALHKAAERGVKVRLLLDDNGIGGLDSIVATLNQHQNINIRLFNPSTVRSPKLLGYFFDFFRLNRRMHNKSIIVDSVATIIGGRNIGDEYFQITDGDFFVDLDVLAVGPVVPSVLDAFDDYWNSRSVYDVNQIISMQQIDWAGFESGVAKAQNSKAASVLSELLESDVNRLTRRDPQLEWVDVQLVVDDPAKGLGKASRDQLMITRLVDVLGAVNSSMDLVSAYFIPGDEGSDWIIRMAKGGATVRVLTNALTTTDVAMVHSGYVKYRTRLLESGVSLFELKPRSGAPMGRDELNVLGLSGAGLHAKTFAVDHNRIFIGSFNFDPRSAQLNCEMGFLIHSAEMAKHLSFGFDTFIPKRSYEPVLSGDALQWLEIDSVGAMITHDSEPGASWFDKIALQVLGWLPIEWLL